MFNTLDNNLLYIAPICSHPTTVMLVDDDGRFVEQLALQLSSQFACVTFTSVDAAIKYYADKRQDFIFKRDLTKGNSNIVATIRDEIYNADRFKEVVISVIDYDMPNKNGFDMMVSMGTPESMACHSYILLTGKSPKDFNARLTNSNVAKNLVSKGDPAYIPQLIKQIQDKSASIFQWSSYATARRLSFDVKEKPTFFFDGNFMGIFNAYIYENKICELYLFDRQGSFLFLDKDANLSWLFVRNDMGVAKSIATATKYNAPEAVIKALKSKEVILSLYEPQDFAALKNISWEKYLLPATILPTDDKYTSQLNLHYDSNYYYAFTKDFPSHGIARNKILSYQEFIDGF